MYALTEVGEGDGLPGLRPAQAAETEEVIQAQARDYFESLGVDPLAQDPVGFRERTAAHTAGGRIWVARDEDGIAFKADVATQTEEAAYLEAIWTRPDLRGRGLGTVALMELCRRLLGAHRAVCLFADAHDARLRSFYRRVGFEPLALYHVVRFRPIGA